MRKLRKETIRIARAALIDLKSLVDFDVGPNRFEHGCDWYKLNNFIDLVEKELKFEEEGEQE